MNHQPAYNPNPYDNLQMESRISYTKPYIDSSPKPEIPRPKPSASASLPVSSTVETSVTLASTKSKRPANKEDSQYNNILSNSSVTLSTNLPSINNTATAPSSQRSTQHQLTVAQLLSQKHHQLEVKEEKLKEIKHPKKNDSPLDTLDIQNSKKKNQTNINNNDDHSSNSEISTNLTQHTSQEVNKQSNIDENPISSGSFQSGSIAETKNDKFLKKFENKINQDDTCKLVYNNIQTPSSISQITKAVPTNINQVVNYESQCLNNLPQKTVTPNNSITPETPSLSTLYVKNITIGNPQQASQNQLVESNENQIQSLNTQKFNISNQENGIFTLNQTAKNKDNKSLNNFFDESKISENYFNINLKENVIEKNAQFDEFMEINGQITHENDSSARVVANTENVNQEIQEASKVLNKNSNNTIAISEFPCFDTAAFRRIGLNKKRKYLSLPTIHSKDFLDANSFVETNNLRKCQSKSSESIEKIASLKENINKQNFEKIKETFKTWQIIIKDNFLKMISLKSKLKNNSILVNKNEIGVKPECHGYHKAMVECQNCGYFCHEDCVHVHEANKYCSFCFKQKNNREILNDESKEIELIQKK
jgi:hypothetical protein